MQGLTFLRHPIYAMEQFLVEGYYVTFALWHESSICRLSVVCNVDAHQAIWTFQQYFCIAFNSSGTRTVCIKIVSKNS